MAVIKIETFTINLYAVIDHDFNKNGQAYNADFNIKFF